MADYDPTAGRDTTADSISYDPGATKGRDTAGNIVDVPAPTHSAPSVDKTDKTDDSGELKEVVDQEKAATSTATG